MVAMAPPAADDGFSLLSVSKPALIQVLITELTVQAFHKGVLSRFVRLDKVQPDTLFLTPKNIVLLVNLQGPPESCQPINGKS